MTKRRPEPVAESSLSKGKMVALNGLNLPIQVTTLIAFLAGGAYLNGNVSTQSQAVSESVEEIKEEIEDLRKDLRNLSEASDKYRGSFDTLTRRLEVLEACHRNPKRCNL